MEIYKSKIDAGYWLMAVSALILLAIGVYVLIGPLDGSVYTIGGILILLLGVSFLAVVIGLPLKIRYIMYPDRLVIKGWIYGGGEVRYDAILHIRKSNIPDNTGCLSNDRIEFRTPDGIFTVSPKDRDGFLRDLSKYYPDAADAI